ncbi:hypothetical protein [Romboutsia lituseburensis]|uniref:hypothetical protein n=1 Tax=Romboutsia lituseburensis TaxID=1537 RepID=UPI00215B75FE|nr:hypothetical protein [Romboutsia lituseburensis]MCR8747234.1 hypothetical protein [Romboutsia lituseburensis]
MSKYIKLLEANSIADNDSFLYFLHEKWDFRKDKFIQLCEAIIEITKYDLNQNRFNVIDRRISSSINHIHEYILSIFLCENLFYDIKNLPSYEERLEYVATLNKVVSCYFKGLIIEESIEDGLNECIDLLNSN